MSELPLLTHPAAGVPDVIDTPARLRSAAEALAHGSGPVAVDAERASGIRYDHRAFLVQLKRAGSGIHLIDAEGLSDLTSVGEALSGVEWVLHAANQDLPSLQAKGLRPDRLFDTELAARLLGYERFGLASVVASTLGVRLAKEHSNVDWSQRPLDPDWLNYAALDVEVLIDVREVLYQQLATAGKLEYSAAEFEHLKNFTPKTYIDPWRRTHGVGALRSRRALGRVRAMWQTRDQIARSADITPSAVVRDRALLAAASDRVRSTDEMLDLSGAAMLTRARAARLYRALREADKLPAEQLPPLRSPDSAPRPEVARPLAKERVDRMKQAVNALATELQMAHDVLLSPGLIKALAGKETIGDQAAVAQFLTDHGARTWQIKLTAQLLAQAAAGH